MDCLGKKVLSNMDFKKIVERNEHFSWYITKTKCCLYIELSLLCLTGPSHTYLRLRTTCVDAHCSTELIQYSSAVTVMYTCVWVWPIQCTAVSLSTATLQRTSACNTSASEQWDLWDRTKCWILCQEFTDLETWAFEHKLRGCNADVMSFI